MEAVDINEARKNLSKLLSRVAAGEEIVIAKFGKPVARLFPYAAPTQPKFMPRSRRAKGQDPTEP